MTSSAKQNTSELTTWRPCSQFKSVRTPRSWWSRCSCLSRGVKHKPNILGFDIYKGTTHTHTQLPSIDICKQQHEHIAGVLAATYTHACIGKEALLGAELNVLYETWAGDARGNTSYQAGVADVHGAGRNVLDMQTHECRMSLFSPGRRRLCSTTQQQSLKVAARHWAGAG